MITSIAREPDRFSQASTSVGMFNPMIWEKFTGIKVHRSGVAKMMDRQCLLMRLHVLMNVVKWRMVALLPSNEGNGPCANTRIVESISFANRVIGVRCLLEREYQENKGICEI